MTVNFKHHPAQFSLDSTVPDSASVWQSKMESAFPELRVSPLGEESFHASYRSAGSENLQISEIRASAHVVERHPGVVTAQNYHYFKVSLQLSGTGEMSQGDRHFQLTPGMLTVYDTSQPYDLRFDDEARFLIAMFPQDALDIPPGLAAELSANPVDCTSGVGEMVSDYLCGLSDNLSHFAGPSGERMARTGLSLLSTLLVSEEEKLFSESQPLRASLLMEMCFFINKHLTNPDLNPELVAAAHFISTRQLYNVFKDTGVSVAQWIKQRRLAECKRELADPLLAQSSVGTIARRWSFDEAPYFSRIFRETYGMTPSQWRQAALGGAEKHHDGT